MKTLCYITAMIGCGYLLLLGMGTLFRALGVG